MKQNRLRKNVPGQDHHSHMIVCSLTAILIMLLCVSTGFLTACSKSQAVSATVDSDATTQEDTTQEVTTQEETTTTAPDVEIDLMMIGDMLIHEGVYNSGLQPDGTYNFDHLFANIQSDISEADIRVVNQETILGGTELGLSGYPCFNSPYEIGDAEVKAGFNVILQATNHALDKGLTGIENDLNYWRTNHPETTVLGIHETQEEYDNDYTIYEKDGFKIAMLNYTYGTNGIALPSSKPFCVSLLDADKIKKDIAAAKQVADMVIVFPHWGTEYQYTPDSNQEYWTNLFLSLGVDVVIGSHPHVMEPVEVLTGTDGHQMLVYYSLGNFVSNQDQKARMVGGMAKVSLVKNSAGECYIKDYSYIPIVTQKLFGTSAITSYKLSDYTEALASTNAIRKDEGCSDFSLSYCNTLCSQVFGELYDQSTSSVHVTLRSD